MIAGSAIAAASIAAVVETGAPDASIPIAPLTLAGTTSPLGFKIGLPSEP